MSAKDLKSLLKPAGPPKEPTCAVTGVLLDEVKALSPGQVLRLQGRDGQMIAIMDYADFEHLCEKAGMGTKPTSV